MTTLQVAYQQALEQERHNREMERETNRSNSAREAETYRSNVAKETETHRSNTVQEKQNALEVTAKWLDTTNKVLTGGRGIFGTQVDQAKVLSGLL